MKKSIFSILFTSLLLIGFMASCNMQPGAFTISLYNYAPYTDTAWVTVSNDNANCQVRGAECYWTFDGTEPSDSQTQNTNVESYGSSDKDFTITIPSDFYSGTIKFLCKITYSMMGKTQTVTQVINKPYTVEYHDANSMGKNLTLEKNKGFAKSYTISKVAGRQTETINFTAAEDGIVTITVDSGKASLSINGQDLLYAEDDEFSAQAHEGDAVSITYDSAVYISAGSTSSITSAQYKIILK